MNHEPDLDRMFHALADGHRRAMIERLAAGALSVSDLAAPLQISLPAVMQHIAVLEACGLVQTRKQGRVRRCTLDQDAMNRAEGWIAARRGMMESRLSRLDQFLAQDGKDK